MKTNIYMASVQQDLKNAAKFIDKNTPLTAKLNSRNQIELKTDQGVMIKRIEGEHVAKKMNLNKLSIYV